MSLLVVVESPYSGDILSNVYYAVECMQDCLQRGEAPFLSHLMYTMEPHGYVPDTEERRTQGLNAAYSWLKVAQLMAVYYDKGISAGMKAAIDKATELNIPITYRSIKGKTMLKDPVEVNNKQ